MEEGIKLPPETDDEEVTTPRTSRYENQDNYGGGYGGSYGGSRYGGRYGREDRQRETITDIDLEKRKWSNRRRMAWLAFISMILVTAALLFAPIEASRIKILSEPITWFYFAMASVIGAYMGFTTWASKKGKR